jgi:protein canopy 3/4
VKPKKKKEYKKSETRFIESMEDVCERVLEYNIHKERKDSTRFAKGMSETFQTLHGLVDKGVKVELGIPLELWDKPSAEVTQLKTQCEMLQERYEPDIEEWYNNHQEEGPLIDYLCRDRVLKKKDSTCLYEVVKPKGESNDDDEEKPKKKSAKKPKKPTEDELPKEEL